MPIEPFYTFRLHKFRHRLVSGTPIMLHERFSKHERSAAMNELNRFLEHVIRTVPSHWFYWFNAEERWDGAVERLPFWTMAAVVLHVALDWLNVYGVQCFRPLSRRWHHLDILALFEPPLFAMHSVGLLLWTLGTGKPGPTFLVLYALTFVYIALRGWQHAGIVNKVKRELGQAGVCHVVPSLWWFHWQFVFESEQRFYNGTVKYGQILVRDVFDKERSHPDIQATLGTDGVRAFLHFAQRVHVKLTERQDGYDVQWRDLRFWYNHKLPFGVDVKLDREMNVVSDTLGWMKIAWEPPFV